MKIKEQKATNGIILLLAFLTFYAIGFIYKQVAFSFVETKVSFWIEWCIRYAFIYGIGMSLFILITKKVPQEIILSPQKIGFKRFLKYCIIAIGLAMASGFWQNLLFSFITGTPLTEIPNYFAGGSTLGALFFLCIVPPITEELFFRKILLHKLNAYGNGIAVFGSALAFSIYHTLLTSFQILHVFLLGLIFAYVMFKTRNIIYPILIHSIINFWSVWTGRITVILPEPFSIFAQLLIFPIMISFIVILVINRSKVFGFIKKLFKNQEIE